MRVNITCFYEIKTFCYNQTMKHVFRMIVFSVASIFLTSLWNKGFTIQPDPMTYLKASVLIAILYYLITPLSKIVFIPFNILSLGFLSVLVYFALFYFVFHFFPLIQIKEWIFPKTSIFGFSIPSFPINYWQNLILSSVSVSSIINFFELAL